METLALTLIKRYLKIEDLSRWGRAEMEDQGRRCLHSCVCFHSTYLIWHWSILGEMKWRRTPEIQIFLWSIFQFAWPLDRVNSFASAATRRLCLPTPTSVTYPWWKNRPPQLHAGNSRCHVSGAKPGLQTTDNLWTVTPQKRRGWTDVSGWRDKQARLCFGCFKPATEARFFIKRCPDQIPTKPRSVHAHTRAVSHTLTAYPLDGDIKRNGEIKKSNCRHIKPSVAFKA